MSQRKIDTSMYFDDATVLEVVNLLNIGLSSYRVKDNVPSHIPAHNQFIDSKNLKSQNYLNKISEWTDQNLMALNVKKNEEHGFQLLQQLSIYNRHSLEE